MVKKSVSLESGQVRKSVPISLSFWNVANVVFIISAFFSLLLPTFIGNLHGNLYYVRGVDMIFGRSVQTDPVGMIPQIGEILVALCLILGLICYLVKNKVKSVILTCALSVYALIISTSLPFQLKQATSTLLIQQIVYGYYLTEVLIILTVISSAMRIAVNKLTLREITNNKWLYIMAAIVVTYCLVFFYYPIYGVLIAFKDYNPTLGILGSKWVGFDKFIEFFKSYYIFRLIRNTLAISILDIVFGFTSPIIFALLLNEIGNRFFKKTIQTITYLPHFISLVIVCGLLVDFLSTKGLINNILSHFGVQPQNYLMNPSYFWGIYTASGVWQGIGWGSIIYLAALTAIDPALYEAATVDGANRWKMMLHITIPCLLPTVIIMFILRMGSLMGVGYEKVILLYNDNTLETADVISSFVYRRGITQMDYSFSAAVDLFNSVINFGFLFAANKISKKVSEYSLW